MTLEYGRMQACPGVVSWFYAYCAAMTLLYLICVAAGGFILGSTPADEDWIAGVVLLAIGAPLAIAFGIAPFLPRRKWVWVYGLVLICLGLTSACVLVASIPLLIFWIKPETKAWFGPPAS